MSRTRSPRRHRWWQTAAAAVAVGLTVALTQNTTTAAFTGQTSDTGNQATASGNFCTSPGGTTLIATADTTVYQGNPATSYGSDVSIAVTSGAGGNARVLIGFTLPTLGTGCSLTAATLRMYVTSGQTGRTVDVYRIDPAASWTEAAATWNTTPATTGTAVSAASLATGNWQTWTVTTMVTALYSGVNNGFLVRDSVDSNSPTRTQYWDSRESATAAQRPQLVLTWS